MVQVVLPNDANPLGFILGGTVMHLIDIAGAIACHRHTRSLLVTAAVDGLQFLQDLIYRHRVMPPPSVTLNNVNAMGTGELAMALATPSTMQNYRRVQGLVFDVAPMPRKATRLTSGGGVAWHLAAATPNLNEAWELHKFVASQEVQIEECNEGSVAPPRTGRSGGIRRPAWAVSRSGRGCSRRRSGGRSAARRCSRGCRRAPGGTPPSSDRRRPRPGTSDGPAP